MFLNNRSNNDKLEKDFKRWKKVIVGVSKSQNKIEDDHRKLQVEQEKLQNQVCNLKTDQNLLKDQVKKLEIDQVCYDGYATSIGGDSVDARRQRS